MKATAKYLFDEDFAAGEKPTITMVEHERRRADAELQAYRQGFTAGQEQAHQEATKRMADALSVIADGLDRLDGALTAIETRLETEAVEVAVAVAAKLAAGADRARAVRRDRGARDRMLSPSGGHAACHRSHCGETSTRRRRRRSRRSHERRGFDGRLAIIADESLAPGDCRVEWADGGIIRDSTATASVIDETVARYIAARNMPAA